MIIGVSALAGGGSAKVIPGEPRLEWCNWCMTSSAVRLRFYVLREDTDPIFVHQVGLSYACMQCHPGAFGMDDGEGPDGDTPAPALV